MVHSNNQHISSEHSTIYKVFGKYKNDDRVKNLTSQIASSSLGRIFDSMDNGNNPELNDLDFAVSSHITSYVFRSFIH